MAQGQKISDWQIETIRATWLLTRNCSEASRNAGCHASTASRYVAAHREELAHLAHDKKPEIADVIRCLLERTLSVAFDQKKLSDASFAQIVTGIGILVDKHQLLTGKATSRSEQSNPLIVWSDDEVAALAEMAERRKAGGLIS